MDLKKLLMELGNKLVTEHRFDPAMGLDPDDPQARTTHPIAKLTAFINRHPEAQQCLRELGFDWSMPKK